MSQQRSYGPEGRHSQASSDLHEHARCQRAYHEVHAKARDLLCWQGQRQTVHWCTGCVLHLQLGSEGLLQAHLLYTQYTHARTLRENVARQLPLTWQGIWPSDIRADEYLHSRRANVVVVLPTVSFWERACGREHRVRATSFWAALLAMICCVCRRPSAALLLRHLTSSFPRAPVRPFFAAWLSACCSAVSTNR